MNNPTAFRALRAVLATNYPTQEDARRVVAEAGLDQAYFQFSDKAVNNWHNLLPNQGGKAHQKSYYGYFVGHRLWRDRLSMSQSFTAKSISTRNLSRRRR